ncbi:outer membrane protein assembly factor BamE [Roseateles violae]|uniref:Outer membrane protein assembly factor BamE n=1 Tax=Roseateles violae TaxID=3058042 RepID=A0ABT8DLM8_9BURK|nr:outer membrane protein assembly factor BamE [Pelomonas sp. PFR6]MDN3918803.1 outer membrane protein assembly factor BamE [Pelomonas sp. PFR6]
MRLNFRTARPLPGLLALCAALSACSGTSSQPELAKSGDTVLGFVRPYRVEVVQGNVLTKELVSRVKPGMSRAQVRDLLGSPLLTDMFHDNRWDYSFAIRRQGAPYQQRRVVAWFDGDQLKSLEVPDDLPSENEFVAAITTFPSGKAPKLELSEEERKALPVPVRPPAPTPEAMGVQRSYPPLEGR